MNVPMYEGLHNLSNNSQPLLKVKHNDFTIGKANNRKTVRG